MGESKGALEGFSRVSVERSFVSKDSDCAYFVLSAGGWKLPTFIPAGFLYDFVHFLCFMTLRFSVSR